MIINQRPLIKVPDTCLDLFYIIFFRYSESTQIWNNVPGNSRGVNKLNATQQVLCNNLSVALSAARFKWSSKGKKPARSFS